MLSKIRRGGRLSKYERGVERSVEATRLCDSPLDPSTKLRVSGVSERLQKASSSTPPTPDSPDHSEAPRGS